MFIQGRTRAYHEKSFRIELLNCKGRRCFQNDLTGNDTRDKLANWPDNQDLIGQRPGIILWTGAMSVNRLAVYDEVLEVEKHI